ncbi:MAG: hypothetical protein MK110_09245 [Fuerstiella sp.]|nr:hypothetical protein [Fuerstiella sp.]
MPQRPKDIRRSLHRIAAASKGRRNNQRSRLLNVSPMLPGSKLTTSGSV